LSMRSSSAIRRVLAALLICLITLTVAFVVAGRSEHDRAEGVLLLTLETRNHGSWVATLTCTDAESGIARIQPRLVRSSGEPVRIRLPPGVCRVVLDGMPRKGERGERYERCGRYESTVQIRSGQATALHVPEPLGADLLVMIVDVARSEAQPPARQHAAEADGLYLVAPGRLAHEVVFHRPEGDSKTFGRWSSWSPEWRDDAVSGSVPAGDFELRAVHGGRVLGSVPVHLVDGEVNRVVLPIE